MLWEKEVESGGTRHSEVVASLSEKARLEQNFEGEEWVSQADIWEKGKKWIYCEAEISDP